MVQPPAVFWLTEPVEFCLEVKRVVQLCLWPSECSLASLFLAAGSCEPAGDGTRGCALHGHPGEVRPSLLLQVRSKSPPRQHCSHSSFLPKKSCGASQQQVPCIETSVGNCCWAFHRSCLPIPVIICPGKQQTGLM